MYSTCHRIIGEMLYLSPEVLAELKVKNQPEPIESNYRSKFDFDSISAVPDDSTNFKIVEIQPQFPGGDIALMNFISFNFKYPKTSLKNNVTGKGILEFIISEKGEIMDPKITQSVSPEIDQEMLRVVSLMPRWLPGTQNGKPVKVKFTLPLKFGINNPTRVKEKK